MSTPRKAHVVFRNVPGTDPAWQYYGLDLPVVGGADSLSAAQALASDAAEFTLDADVDVVPVLEWQAVAPSAGTPGTYVRAMKSSDARWTTRSEFAQWLRERFQSNREEQEKYYDSLSSTGDVIACAVLPEDSVQQLLTQASSHGTVHFAMPSPEGPICWLSITGPETPDSAPGSLPLRDLDVSDETSVLELMRIAESCQPHNGASRTLTLA
ncbi:MAG: hypothetical protein L0H59_05785 [Tomitella sp.]|nr:hypothetical protein [Tomitella sp.]